MTPYIVRRYEWSARPSKTPPTTVPLASRMATCVHHDGPTPISIKSYEDAVALLRRDQSFHMDTNGWNDIAYNYLVISAPGYQVDGQIFEGRGRDGLGAHCTNWNTPWIGIQVAIGGGQIPSPASLASVRWLHDGFCADAKRALAMKGHKDGFPTACPDGFLYSWIRAGMPVGAQIPAKVVVANAVKAIVKAPVRVVAAVTGRLVVDGDFGPATRKALQRWACVPQDGNLGPVSWKAIQRRIGVRVLDGVPGPLTWQALQRMVDARPVDGVPGPVTIKALQTYLNAH